MGEVRYERVGAAALLTIDRPERRNAVDAATARSLREGFESFEADDGARALVLTGAGGEAFCAGADLKALDLDVEHPAGPMGFSRLAASKPTIAAIDGWCLAGGVELAALSEAGEWVWLVPADKGDDPAGLVQYHGTIRRIVGPADPIGSAPKELERAIRVCRPCLHGERPAFHVHSYTDRASDAKRLFDEQVDAMEARLRSMRRIRVRKHIPSLAEPHDLMIVDELLLLAKLLKEGAESPPGMILTVGRKAAFTVCALSQLPQKDVIGDLRDLFPQRIALAMRSRSMTDAVLGPGAVAAGALAHEIPGSMPGVGFMYSDGTRGYTRIRAALVDDEEADLIARGCLPDGLAVRYVPLPDDLGVAIPYPADPLDDVPIDA